jgi:hypothetical protein
LPSRPQEARAVGSRDSRAKRNGPITTRLLVGFWNLSASKGLDIRVEYADICPVPNTAAYHEEHLLDAFA